MQMLKMVCVLVALLTAAACATTTTIVSEPPGAKVYDTGGKELGSTPYSFTSESWLWEKEELVLRKSGFRTHALELDRSEIDLMPTLGSVGLCLCFGWTGIGGIGGVLLFLAGGLIYPEETLVKMDPKGAASKEAKQRQRPVATVPVSMGY